MSFFNVYILSYFISEEYCGITLHFQKLGTGEISLVNMPFALNFTLNSINIHT